ncbi:MAG: pyridoxamine 5'-phosphate oxidase family protein [Acidimicrobiales bacterium]|jgi:nitroimidazol reductase NimA-like FMN-containing flavoprotein (pyridoxamine 5'-phosphate oxidase superfamily)
MSEEERDKFLAVERMCRVGSVDSDGSPHVSPLWFAWDGTAISLNSIVGSKRWVNLMQDGRISVTVDAGVEFSELRGVEITGTAEVVGDVPRTHGYLESVREPERLFGEKYLGGTFRADGRHARLRIVPEKIVSWDFRKMPVP